VQTSSAELVCCYDKRQAWSAGVREHQHVSVHRLVGWLVLLKRCKVLQAAATEGFKAVCAS
jgi:hypothetical protein